MADSPVQEGDVIVGKYQVERVLGAGGMGVVVAAQHLQLRQRVAIKFLLASANVGGEGTARFIREAQAAARIQSEHVARVLDVATLADGTPYMVMEFLEGRDLGELLAERGALPLEEAVGYLLEACEGVAEAHAAGIIHRDLKPANLFLCSRGAGRTSVKVLDFGISKSVNPAAVGELGLTKTATVMGSPLYMSPEQMVSAKRVDTRTDIWSLGVTLFELVTGARPFSGESLTELIANVLQNPPLSLRQVRAEIAPAFDAALSRSLEKEREQRYPSIAEFAAAIAPFGPRYASLSVERISQTLVRSLPVELQATQAAAPLESPALRTAPRPQPAPAPGGGTTAQPVAHEVVSEGVAGVPLAKRSTALILGPLAAAALLAIGAGSAWWISGARHSELPGAASATALTTAVSGANAAGSASQAAAIAPQPAATASAQPVSSAQLPALSASTNLPPPVPTVRRKLKLDPWERRDK